MLLLYPGFKGTPSNEPYKSFHDALLERLLTADIIYVIGFAFRDEFINNQFDIALKINPDLHVYCFNPVALAKLPVESKMPFFVEKYPNKFHHVAKAIAKTDGKLPLLDANSHLITLTKRRINKELNKFVDTVS